MSDEDPLGAPSAAPYGTWASDLDADVVARGSVRLSSPAIDGGDVYWIERRPLEKGRHVLVRRDAQGRSIDITPPGSNVSSRVHEYGRSAYLAAHGVVYYVENSDQRLYRLDRAAPAPVPVTPDGPWRYADLDRHPTDQLIVCVREDHSLASAEPVNTIAALSLDAGAPTELLVAGHDFYACPRFSPDGSRLLWLAWRHPQMPWDGTELWVADVVTAPSGLRLTNAQLVAGGITEAIFQPGWISDRVMAFVSDRTGWWNLYRADLQQHRFESRATPLCAMRAEFGRPLWRLGEETWAAFDAERLVVSYVERGRWSIGLLHATTGELVDVPCGLSPASGFAIDGPAVVFVGQSSTERNVVVRLDLGTGEVETLNDALDGLPGRDVSTPEPFSFATTGDAVAHAFFYRPKHRSFEGVAGEQPPLIVISHGGPTAAASTALDFDVQFWTNRGFAVVDVDYRGSTGYGRAYRAALSGQWGIADVDDCVNAARHLAAIGRVDADRMVIRGASAGGYTTFAALTTHPDVFKAGASYFGVSDLEALVADTHKFEARYLDSLVGPYPERRDVYLERSPIHAVDRLACPLILFQGLDDRVVPPSQTQVMADALRRKGLPVAVLMFEGEQHGFRRAETIRRCLEAELYFYGVVFGFTPAGHLEPVEIENV